MYIGIITCRCFKSSKLSTSVKVPLFTLRDLFKEIRQRAISNFERINWSFRFGGFFLSFPVFCYCLIQ